MLCYVSMSNKKTITPAIVNLEPPEGPLGLGVRIIEKNKKNRIEILKAIKHSENILLSLQRIDSDYEVRQVRY